MMQKGCFFVKKVAIAAKLFLIEEGIFIPEIV